MYLLVATVCFGAVVWCYPRIGDTLKCAATNVMASTVTNYIALQQSRAKMSRKCATIREIVHNYRTGAVSLTTLVDFTLFKCRMYSTELFENGLVTDGDGTMEVVYYLRDTRYKIVVPKRRGPRPILRISLPGDEGDEVTPQLREHLGPYGNFNGIPTTPKMLGYDGLVVTYRKGRKSILYDSSDIIVVDA